MTPTDQLRIKVIIAGMTFHLRIDPHEEEETASEEEIRILKKTKSGEAVVDIRPMIKSASAVYDNGKIRISCILSSDSQSFLNPEYIVTALRQRLGILPEGAPFDKEWYTILRLGYFKADGSVFR